MFVPNTGQLFRVLLGGPNFRDKFTVGLMNPNQQSVNGAQLRFGIEGQFEHVDMVPVHEQPHRGVDWFNPIRWQARRPFVKPLSTVRQTARSQRMARRHLERM